MNAPIFIVLLIHSQRLLKLFDGIHVSRTLIIHRETQRDFILILVISSPDIDDRFDGRVGFVRDELECLFAACLFSEKDALGVSTQPSLA